MPPYLRKDSVRLLEAGIEHYSLAVVSLSVPRRHPLREPAACHAPSIALLGAAVEHLMAAVLVHVYGKDFVKTGDRFKLASEILADFRSLISSPPQRAAILMDGLDDGTAHLARIREAIGDAPRLIALRAGGIHNGIGPSYDVCLFQAHRVHHLFELVSMATKLRPYFATLRPPTQPSKTLQVLLQDLRSNMDTEKDLVARTQIISSIYLLLPDVPATAPDWVDTLRRLLCVPNEDDISLLLRAAENAFPAELIRATRGTVGAIPVIVRPDDPNAIPIAPQHLRRGFTQFRDQVLADLANANGRLDAGRLDLPPMHVVLELFAKRYLESWTEQTGAPLSGHEAWPFIASSLNYPGTTGPYWFIVKSCSDLPQATARLRIAAGLNKANRQIIRRLSEYEAGIDAVSHNRALLDTNELVKDVRRLLSRSNGARRSISKVTSQEYSISPYDGWESELREIAEGDEPVGTVLKKVLGEGFQLGNSYLSYWARRLSDAASHMDDVEALVAVLANNDLIPAHTAARQALRLIDAATFGPTIT